MDVGDGQVHIAVDLATLLGADYLAELIHDIVLGGLSAGAVEEIHKALASFPAMMLTPTQS